MKSLAKNSLYNVLYNVTNIVFVLLTSIYVSRILQPEGVGRYAYAQTFASYFVSFASLGIPIYGVREIAKVRDESEKKNRVFSELFLINAISSCIAFVCYMVIVLYNESFRADSSLYVCMSMLIAANALNIDWLYMGEENYGYITLRSIIIKVISFVLIICLIRKATDVIWYAAVTVLASCGNYIFNVIHAKKYVRLTLKGLVFRRHLKPLAILSASSFLGGIYNKIDITMLGALTTKYAVGIYENAHKIVLMITTCCTSITAAFMPKISNTYKMGSRDELVQIVNAGLEVMVFLGIPFAFGLWAVSDNAVALLYGTSFADSATTIKVFSSLVLIRGIGDLVCYQLLVATENEKMRLPANMLTTCINICLNLILIPILRENGAALASIISELFVNGYLYLKMRKKVAFGIPVSSVVQAVAASSIMFIIIKLIERFCMPSGLVLICSVGIGSVVYFFVSYIFKNTLMISAVTKTRQRKVGK